MIKVQHRTPHLFEYRTNFISLTQKQEFWLTHILHKTKKFRLNPTVFSNYWQVKRKEREGATDFWNADISGRPLNGLRVPSFSTHQARTVVARKVLFTHRNEAPERMFCRHVHQKNRGEWSLSLAVTVCWIVDGVGFEDWKKIFLAKKSRSLEYQQINSNDDDNHEKIRQNARLHLERTIPCRADNNWLILSVWTG